MHRQSIISSFLLLATCLLIERAQGQDEPPAWSAPQLERAICIVDGRTGESVSFSQLLDDLAAADVVFLGESHNDETTHRVELAVFEGLLQRRKDQVVLAMEMFERDVQPQLDKYLAGEIDEAQFLADARPWENYRSAYRPLVELAKRVGAPVIASNFPRPLRMQLAMKGAEAIKSLDDEQAGQVPSQFFPNTQEYWRRVDNAIRGHRGMMQNSGGDDQRLYSTQSLWDNSMGDACATALKKYPDHSVLHVNGGFHSAYWDGTVHQLKQRTPEANVKTVAITPVTNPSVADGKGKPVADFVVYAEARATDISDGDRSVYVERALKYRFELPQDSSDAAPVPLLIWLSDDGFTADDGLELWRQRLGDKAALAVIEAPYREVQSDAALGGRWYWSDTFSSDVGTMVDGVERVWGYLLRHYPIDPQRVCVAGEGTGATVAAAVALLTSSMDIQALAIAPSHYAKLKDFPLPLPEMWGEDTPPTRTLQVLGPTSGAEWWAEELEQYNGIGLKSRFVSLGQDPWEREADTENALRKSLGLEPLRTSPSPERAYILIDNDAPCARHWARLHALWLSQKQGISIAATDSPPADGEARRISTEIRPEAFLTKDALPRCPGPFGGTTVLVLPQGTDQDAIDRWMAIEKNDPLAQTSRFHRIRIACADGDPGLQEVLKKLESENRKNILIVPAAFCADPGWMRALNSEVRDFENEMTLHWLPGLGGQQAALTEDVSSAATLPVQHQLQVTMDPVSHDLAVTDRLRLPGHLRRKGTEFSLNGMLEIQDSQPATEAITGQGEPVQRYRLKEDASDGILQLAYQGKMDFALSDQKEEYTRGFRETRGVVGQQGVYLDGDSVWIPSFDDAMIEFAVTVDLPERWHIISQGSGSSRTPEGQAHWQSESPMEQVYLVGGPLHRTSDAAGAVELSVYLREQDDALTQKYLDAGARYLEMYRQLIGPYPYAKFALVENFWETGYGMPSFTLLGPQVIRFPFILHSSYPHEILHNWWGNSVFVDYESGNWCEGLTAYMSDHLIQEQRGVGSEYRRNTLQKYRDYVKEGRDFPLVEFRSRHSAATEAVGYGKVLMLFHMLRRDTGDDAFRSALASFYRKQRGKRAGFSDLCAEFESVVQRDFKPFFSQWTERGGAPALAVKNVQARKTDSGYSLSGTLEQTQSEPPFSLSVPVYVQTSSSTETFTVAISERQQEFLFETESPPLVLRVDPAFDLFRVLDARETPPSIGQLFGEAQVVAVLPAAAEADTIEAYRQLLNAWQSDDHQIELVLDKDLDAIPTDQSVWILGRQNRWVGKLFGKHLIQKQDEDDGVDLVGQTVPFADHSLVVVRRHPQSLDKAVGWLTVNPTAAFAGMGRKLPHYGKYSYLAFQGDEPTNIVKGQWSANNSPLSVMLTDNSAQVAEMKDTREPLAKLPPVFSTKAMREHVTWLAATEREGRGLDSTGLRQSADYIAQQFAAAGLQPGGDEGTWFQHFEVAKGPAGIPVEAVNVVGILPGKRTDWSDQSIVLGAHYDHLGFGWPDVRSGAEGKLHPGADDNASGVAVMLELARNLAAEGGGSRSLVFVAFSAEECGRLGSKFYVQHPVLPAEQIRGMINLDTVGRLRDRPLAIHGTGTADEWQHIFRGCGFVTGIPSQNVPEAADASDQMSFIEGKIPAVQIFTGAHEDYHRPSDTLDKVDQAGLVKVATFVKEAIVYLLERDPPLTARIAGTAASTPSPSSSGRKVLFGTVPAFEYQGKGVKIESLVPDSPAEQAGLQPGDVLVRVNGKSLDDLRAFSEFLKTLKAGQQVEAVVLRGGAEQTVRVTVRER